MLGPGEWFAAPDMSDSRSRKVKLQVDTLLRSQKETGAKSSTFLWPQVKSHFEWSHSRSSAAFIRRVERSKTKEKRAMS